MAILNIKATGQRGSWFANVNGESVPCVHKHWTHTARGSMTYDDPHYLPETDAKWGPFLGTLKALKRAILTSDDVFDDGHRFERTGYIALYEIDHVEIIGSHLRFQFVRRLANLD